MKKLSISFYLRASDLKELAELIGHQPACNKCVVQASCYESYIDEYYDTIIDLKEPCEDAMDWFLKAEIIDDEIFEQVVGEERLKQLNNNDPDALDVIFNEIIK